MSQKTNPLSLRLEKSNQNFSSPWFSDFFFCENQHYTFEIEKYITHFLREAQYSKALFSAKNLYGKSNIFLIIQDIRAQEKEKQLSFNLRQTKSRLKQSTLSSLDKINTNNAVKKNQNLLLKNFQDKVFTYGVGGTSDCHSQVDSLTYAEHCQTKEERDFKEKEKKFQDRLVFSFRKRVRNLFLKSKQKYNSKYLLYCPGYLNFFYQKNNFYENEKNLKELWETNWEGKIVKNNFLSFCEKVVKEDITLKKKDILYKMLQNPFFFPTFLPFSKKEKKDIKSEIGSHNFYSPYVTKVYFEPIRFITNTQNVIALLDETVTLIEKRVTFRQLKSRLFQNLSNKLQIKGVRISCSGRLGGRSKKAQKAKMQSDQWGETSLNAFSSKVLFASKSAYTSYGKVGVKIWLSFEESRI